jgi:hypothetical protein
MHLESCGKSVNLAGLRSYLGDLDDWELQAMIDDGRLAWAINVAGATAERRDLRIPLCCVQDCQAGLRRDLDAAHIYRFYFGEATLVKARKIYRALNIKHNHFYALVGEGVIRLAKGSAQRRGPGGGAVVTMLDLVNFITARRIL